MLPQPLNAVIKAIGSASSSVVKNKLERSEWVIKLLKQFKLDPEHPPKDFSGIYVYTLVEYGVGKPEPLLKLFQQNQIKEAFREAFDHNNPSILSSQVDSFVEGYAIGDEIKDLKIDVKREVAAFSTVFIEVTKRSRTPAEVLNSHEQASFRIQLEKIRERLEQRTEGSNQLRVNALAQQMRDWFTTLGYQFETYEVKKEGYFEWIINIPGRRGYDRILLRGIEEGEVRVQDVVALRNEVETQRTDEGWVVSVRRIAPAAREKVKEQNYKQIFCYTFDELIDQNANFSNYFKWLEEEEVKRKGIDTKYLPLACTKEEIDEVTKSRVASSHYENIDSYIDQWLDDPVKEHISILGEFGTGKTWFALHYAWSALQRYREAEERGVARPRIPIVIPLRDYAKAVSVESLFSEFFFRKHNIPLSGGYAAFEQLNRMGKLLLIFDGFDEMAAKIDRQQMINNFWELAKVVVPGSKIILTCRTEHFPEAKEGRALLNAELQASTANLTGEKPQFEVLELEKLSNAQIRQLLSLNTEQAIVEKIIENPQLLDLARRPVMVELILGALPDIEAGKPIDMPRVYLYAVRRKMEQDITAERTFTSLADKLYFLCELSWLMLSTDQMSLNYRLFPDTIRRLFGEEVQQQKDLDHWHYDMMGQTMLIRNADGDYTPCHRSLLEFFVAYKLAAELGIIAADCMELAQEQSYINKNATPQNYKWSSYFVRQRDADNKLLPIAPVGKFITEDFTQLQKTFGKAPLAKAVMDLLLPMLDVKGLETRHWALGAKGDLQEEFCQPLAVNPLIETIKATCNKTEEEVGYLGGNAATLLLKLNKAALEGRDFSRAVIKGGDFINASLCRVNFTEALFENCLFTKVLGSVLSVAFSSDGELLVTGDSDGVVSVWDAKTGRELLICKGHQGGVYSVAMSGDGKTLASGGEDNTIKLWDLQTGQCLKTMANKLYSGMDITGVKGLSDTEKLTLLALGAVEEGEHLNE